ncbi:MAG: hypothetical protein H5T41_05905 [Methanomassiliicoccales archaeon]|jgi:adenosyl cobinamide kinase/adenosyl cobinamide phosphate guanylyltransferase|nr:hypothetical protein [Methanomassiliicoccales archaeon]
MPEENVESLIKSQLGILHSEDILIEALRDLVRDEVKRYIRQKIEENPALKKEIKEAIGEFVAAKIKEVYALMKLTKCGAELGLAMVPKEMKEKLEKDLASLLEREVSNVIERI